MQAVRTNQSWVLALTSTGLQQAEAIEELRLLLLRAALLTLVTHLEDLAHLEDQERVAMAEDCAQDALLAVLGRLADFRGESKFTTWAYKFGVNIALTRARKERWKQVSLDSFSDTGDELDWLPWRESLQTTGSEQNALRSEVAKLIAQIVRTELTQRQRQVLKWIAFDDIPMDVVAQRLDTNRNAIYKLLHDARLKVKRGLSAQGYSVAEIAELFQSEG